MEALHGSSSDTPTLTIRIGGHCLHVANSAPWLVSELDQPRHSTGMAEETVAVTDQYVNPAVGVLGVTVREASAERQVPQRPQGLPGACVDLRGLDYLNVHRTSLCFPHDRSSAAMTDRFAARGRY